MTAVTDRYTFTAALWEWPSRTTWYFVTLSADASADIRAQPRPPRPGFGSIRVHVTLGASRWSTSIFPDSQSGCYVLPVKKSVRQAEGIEADDVVAVVVEVAQ